MKWGKATYWVLFLCPSQYWTRGNLGKSQNIPGTVDQRQSGGAQGWGTFSGASVGGMRPSSGGGHAAL